MTGLLRKSEDKIIRIGIVLIMMLATVMAVEVRWTECDVWIFYAVPALMLLGVISMMMQKEELSIVRYRWHRNYMVRILFGQNVDRK